MEKYQKKIGCFIQIPNIGRGQLKYVGPVAGKPGTFVGIDLLANIGKNDGRFQGRKYFETEYPQSGLFIQFQKVALLIDQAPHPVSRRSTLAGPTFVGTKKISTSSTSPTPIRGSHIFSKNELSYSEMDIDNDDFIRQEYEAKIKQQQEELGQYKKLLDDQRIVLEEIQPAIDDYEEKLKYMEEQISKLQLQLRQERETQKKQKEFFEAEHEQLLAVVEELHLEIKENEKRISENGSNMHSSMEISNEEMERLKNQNESLKIQVEEYHSYKKEQEKFKLKWEKERGQLIMHNDSLNSEYCNLNKELIETQNKLKNHEKELKEYSQEKLKNQSLKSNHLRENMLIINTQGIDVDLSHNDIEQKLSSPLSVSPNHSSITQNHENHENQHSLPLYQGRNGDASAGRSLWCALCERDGHESVDCPFETDLF